MSSARNEGLKYVTSEYVGFVDSDDWIESETYEIAYETATEHNVDLVSWGANIVVEDDNTSSKMVKSAKSYHKIKLTGLYDWDYKLYKDMTVTVWNKLFKTSIIKNENIIFPEGFIHEDNEFLAKYLLHCKKVYYIDNYYYNYLQRNNSIMGQYNNNDKSNSKLVLLDIYKNIYFYYKRYNALEENRELLNLILNSTFCSSYVCSHDKKTGNKKNKKICKRFR